MGHEIFGSDKMEYQVVGKSSIFTIEGLGSVALGLLKCPTSESYHTIDCPKPSEIHGKKSEVWYLYYHLEFL